MKKMSEPPCQSQGYLVNAPDCIPCLFTIILKIILIRLQKSVTLIATLIICNLLANSFGRRNCVNIDVGDRLDRRRYVLVTTSRSW